MRDCGWVEVGRWCKRLMWYGRELKRVEEVCTRREGFEEIFFGMMGSGWY